MKTRIVRMKRYAIAVLAVEPTGAAMGMEPLAQYLKHFEQ
jgi:hypothetical protein